MIRRASEWSGRLGKEVIFISGKNPLTAIGGHASFVIAHARTAIEIGFEPQLFCVGPKTSTTVTDFGVLHQIRSIRPYRPVLLPIHGPLLIASIKRFIGQRKGPHLLHSFGAWGSIGIPISEHLRSIGIKVVQVNNVYTTLRHEYQAKLEGARAGSSLRRRFVHTVEYCWIKYFLFRLEREQVQGSDLVLVNYDSVRRLIEQGYGTNPRIRKISYCSERALSDDQSPGESPSHPIEPRMNLESSSPGTPVILSVSRLDPRKGYHVLIPALAELRSQGIDFRALLVGGGVLLGPLQSLVSKLGLNGFVSLENWVPDVSPYLELADVFVLPSIEEGSGSVSLLEALQAGLPIVASNIDGIPEDVVDEESALLVEPGNVSALAASLRRLMEDASLRKRLGLKARQVFEARFSTEALKSSLREVYTEAGFLG